jgi:hypothetical protein
LSTFKAVPAEKFRAGYGGLVHGGNGDRNQSAPAPVYRSAANQLAQPSQLGGRVGMRILQGNEDVMKMISLFRRFGPSQHDLVEPSWDEVLSNADERQAAAGYWQGVTAAMGDKRAIRPASAHAILRLVVAYVVFDRASAAVMRSGAVDERAWGVQVAASQLAAQIERDLGLSPCRHDRSFPS